VGFQKAINKKENGIIFDIKHFAVHDGPGIRTTVFMKGCPLRCLWCHSPESQKFLPELAFYSELCIGCGICVDSCPNNAQTMEIPKILYRKCKITGRCVDVCYSGALVMYGKVSTIKEIVLEVERDSLMYRKSGGGVTLSGGEPTYQPTFSSMLLETFKKHGINTTIDTCGYADWHIIKHLLKNVDVILFDLKHMDNFQHKQLTGVSNELILSNLEKINADSYPGKLIIRVPVIPGYNDSIKNIIEMSEFLTEFRKIDFIELLPYHNFGVHKYAATGRKYQLMEVKSPNVNRLKYISSFFEKNGLCVKIEGWKDGE